MKHDPQNPKVKEAYESRDRADKEAMMLLLPIGIHLHFRQKTNPYWEPLGVVNDLRANKKMWPFTEHNDGFGTEGVKQTQRAFDNPLLGDSGLKGGPPEWGYEGSYPQ